jgi:recombination protein RecR
VAEAPAEIEALIDLMARLPGLGPRSARRAVLTMVRKRAQLMVPLAEALAKAADRVRPCVQCGNVATAALCPICADPRRADGTLCVVEEVADLWAMERGGAFRGRYHVLGGTLSALDEVGPDELGIPRLVARVAEEGVGEVILALGATVDGQTTAHYIADALEGGAVRVTTLARGVPVGGELDYLDDGTISAALKARRAL